MKFQKANLNTLNSYIVKFYMETMEIGSWKNGKPLLTDDEQSELSGMQNLH